MNKKGFLLAEETLKIILAVIVIGFLAYFLASLYLANRGEETNNLAKASLKYLTDQLDSKAAQIQIYNPDGWTITAWKQGGAMPLQCSNSGWNNCICICDGDCNDNGFCSEYGREIFIKDGSIKISNAPIMLEINYGDKITMEKK
jgi:hypothetical protein